MKTTINSNKMNMNKLNTTSGGSIMKTTRTITMRTIAATIAALSMMSTFTVAASADEIIGLPQDTQIYTTELGTDIWPDELTAPEASEQNTTDRTSVVSSTEVTEEYVNPDAPTAEEIANMRNQSNKNAVKENRLRTLENLLHNMDEEPEIVPANPDAPTEEEIAAIREQNNRKQQRSEMQREYDRLKAELGNEDNGGIAKGDGAILDGGDTGNTNEPVKPVDDTTNENGGNEEEVPTEETPTENTNTSRETEVVGDTVIITESTINEDGTKTIVTTVINTVSGTKTVAISKYDANGRLIVNETDETPETKPEDKTTDDKNTDDKNNEDGNDKKDDNKDNDNNDEEDSWFTKLLKDGIDKVIDKGIDKGLDYVFDDLLGGGDNGWMGIVKKLPWDKVCGTVCNVIDSSLGGDGSGNNGQYSMDEIAAAFTAAYQRADSATLTSGTTNENFGNFNIITTTVSNPDGTKTITQIITNLETMEKTTRVITIDKDGKEIVEEQAEKAQETLPALTVGSTVEMKKYSSDSANTSIETRTDVKDENTAVITKEFRQYSSDGSSVVTKTEITEIRNADGTVTTTKRVITDSRMANYVRGKKIGYINDNTDITLNFHETAEEYLARIEKEKQEEAQYGTLSSHTKYNVDENGNRI